MRPLLLTLLVSSHLSYADTATDTQTLSLTVPLVALIDVQDISPSFTFTAPTEAGQGFEDMNPPSNNKPKIAISSNNSNAKLNVHIDTDLSAANIAIQLEASGLCRVTKTLTTTDKTLCTVGMMKTSDSEVIVRATSPTLGGMIPYGIHTTNIIYTLTQN
jgi:hypothetical protein